jgi:hypothetical protein
MTMRHIDPTTRHTASSTMMQAGGAQGPPDMRFWAAVETADEL